MILSASELKRQLMEGDSERDILPDWESKKKDYADVGQYVKHMTGTSGWKILEAWLLHQLDINVLLRGSDRDRVRAEAFADVLRQVNNWITVGDRATSELEVKND